MSEGDVLVVSWCSASLDFTVTARSAVNPIEAFVSRDR